MLRLVSLNIERDKHLDLIIPFIERVRPDVVCLQELFEEDIPAIEAVAGPCFFVPSTCFDLPRGLCTEGVGIFSHVPLSDTAARRYYGNEGEMVLFENMTAERKVATRRYSLAFASVEKGGAAFRIATTHFLWTPDGSADDHQRAAVADLLRELESEPELILCGDFNAPRGGEIFATLADRYTDNIPSQYLTSIDIELHKAGKLRPHELADKMVDVLFTTPSYRARHADLACGVSDHCAVVADIERA